MGHEEPKQLEKLNAQWLTSQECSVANSTSSSCFATKMVYILYMNTHTQICCCCQCTKVNNVFYMNTQDPTVLML